MFISADDCYLRERREKKLLSAVWYEHLPLEFNFTKFWEFPTSTFKCRESKSKISWHVDQRTVTSRVVADIKCNKNDMLLMNYEAPDGKRLHKRLWNGGNGKGSIRLYRFGRLIDRIECRNVGCGYGEH